ncbi:ABC transporter substrate-binding protein [Nocardioides sp. ChNu-153]|uniref:ABC transporter substrate-binding protein n=1 Tax=unclassified Nocardioides TaxID=2615069 RepID=UPI002406FCD0|nr:MULTISPECIES: ABC transporter substrate-binding protein [unclassified Nocardioides]MDF9714579.1 ABC transporter substrate-binding protein [Nocardioides sp. ChNu-99]MDN7119888.1 ABC transporter substrate-binding protein [Nocardioides sp. ChNu-153]
MTPLRRRATAALALATTLGLAAGCGSSDSDPLAAERDGDAIVIGSQDYYSSEIIAEIYAQALEAEDVEVQRDFRIGQREVYLPEIEDGSIDLFPEYSGPLLQYWEPDTTARLTDDVYAALEEAVPEGLRVLDQADATDQDSYVVTREFSEQYGVTSAADLADVPVELTLGANSEAESRPNGPQGLQEAYGVEVGFTPIEDGGGQLTVDALEAGDIQLAIVYTASPVVAQNDLVVLEDPEGLFLASHVVPVASDNVDDEAAAIIDEVSSRLTPEGLLELNVRSVEDQSPAADIAADWLEEQGLA